VAFGSGKREVEITGEAYFEVQHDAKRPFQVKTGRAVIEDIGTAFDVESYADEPVQTTTLVLGSVRVTGSGEGHTSSVLRPKEQWRLNAHTGEPRVSKDADIDKILAWKNNQFRFDGDDIQTVMRQLARWYDLSVEYRGVVGSHFTGIISRNVPASGVFHLLEATGKIHLQIEGKKMIVTP